MGRISGMLMSTIEVQKKITPHPALTRWWWRLSHPVHTWTWHNQFLCGWGALVIVGIDRVPQVCPILFPKSLLPTPRWTSHGLHWWVVWRALRKCFRIPAAFVLVCFLSRYHIRIPSSNLIINLDCFAQSISTFKYSSRGTIDSRYWNAFSRISSYPFQVLSLSSFLVSFNFFRCCKAWRHQQTACTTEIDIYPTSQQYIIMANR